MNRKGVLLILVAIGIVATLRPTTNTTAAAVNFKSGAVYVLTNQVSNAVAAFDRAPDGTLTAAGTFSTGGAGNPVAQPGDPPTDPLASQGALILSNDKKFLFAVNAGSNEISVLSIGKDALTLVDKVSSGGVRPISLTVHENQ
jgi:6-phosphogluconolactonase (cycloisomerase 2 family)